MSYLLDKKTQKKKIIKIALGVVVFIFLFYIRLSIWNGLSYVAFGIFRPVLSLGEGIGEKFGNWGVYFSSKSSLASENENLKSQILQSEADRVNYASVVAENMSLKEMLGRKDSKNKMVLAAILSKPNQSLYDTLVIDAGRQQGLRAGSIVFAFGDIPVGRVAEIFENSAKVVLFSSPGEKTQVVVPPKNLFMELTGRGGGNFEMILPRDFVLQKGDQVVLPGIHTYVVALAQTTISDPRDPFTKALFTSPVNVQDLGFVAVEQ